VGAAAAFALSRYQLSVAVVERDNDVANGTTKANSAILHAGYDPEPGTLMAALNVEGADMARELCRELDVPYRQCGSLVLAFSPEDEALLQRLLERGRANGVQGLQILGGDEARHREPNLSGEVTAALYAPTAAIVSPWEYALALAETAVVNGVKLYLDAPVTAIEKEDAGYCVVTPETRLRTRYVLNAAGLFADDIHNMAAAPAFSITPDRGEYYLLDNSEGGVVNTVVFQCPTPVGKGTLIAPTVHGNLIVGPNNERPAAREDVATTADGLRQVCELARKSVPDLNLRQSIRNFAGNRSVTEFDDFIIAEANGAPGFVDLAGIKSPGLTAAPAIAKKAVELLASAGLALREKPDFTAHRRRVRFRGLSPARRADIARENSAYGRVICRCETVTEGEILDALRAPIPPRSVDAVKRRCGPGMGRCQGGFCGPRIVELLAKHQGCSPAEILQNTAGTYILTNETKGGTTHV